MESSAKKRHVKRCYISSCPLGQVDLGQGFHRVPANQERQKAWLKAINREKSHSGAYVCSFHFDEGDYEDPKMPLAAMANLEADRRMHLKQTAVPKYFLELGDDSYLCPLTSNLVASEDPDEFENNEEPHLVPEDYFTQGQARKRINSAAISSTNVSQNEVPLVPSKGLSQNPLNCDSVLKEEPSDEGVNESLESRIPVNDCEALAGTRYQSCEPTNKNDSKLTLSYKDMVILAIQSSPEKRMTLDQICRYISDTFPSHHLVIDGSLNQIWQNAIRSTLTHPDNKHIFKRADKSPIEKFSILQSSWGGWWLINSSYKVKDDLVLFSDGQELFSDKPSYLPDVHKNSDRKGTDDLEDPQTSEMYQRNLLNCEVVLKEEPPEQDSTEWMETELIGNNCDTPIGCQNQSHGFTDTDSENPQLSYNQLIVKAIQSSAKQKMTLDQICKYISGAFPNLKQNWHSAIRQNLVDNNHIFQRVDRPLNETPSILKSSSSGWWSINPSYKFKDGILFIETKQPRELRNSDTSEFTTKFIDTKQKRGQKRPGSDFPQLFPENPIGMLQHPVYPVLDFLGDNDKSALSSKDRHGKRCFVVKRCFVPSCPVGMVDCGQGFHRVPANQERQKAWLKAINREKTHSGAYVCSIHFDEDDYADPKMPLAALANLEADKRMHLRQTAVPKYFLQLGDDSHLFPTDSGPKTEAVTIKIEESEANVPPDQPVTNSSEGLILGL